MTAFAICRKLNVEVVSARAAAPVRPHRSGTEDGKSWKTPTLELAR